MNKKLTYEAAGVDIDKADQMKDGLKKTLATSNERVLNAVGAFSSLFDISQIDGISNPVLCLKMEEPGSKQLLAKQHGSLATVGEDLVNHLINDTIMNGGRPLALLDTIVCGELDAHEVSSLIKTMADASTRENCTLVGGETSEQPRVIPSGTYILSAACVGIADRSKVITGERIQAGDVVFAVASNGPHTNGYTLIRTLLDQQPELASKQVGDSTFIEKCLIPHLCYNTPLQEIFSTDEPLHGLAHITGGGVRDNTQRILPQRLDAIIDLSTITVPDIFSAIKEAGDIDDPEMLRTFNCGVGMIYIAPSKVAENAATIFSDHNFQAYQIGEIKDGSGKVKCTGNLQFS